MTAILICVAWLVLDGVAVAELHGWPPPRREPEVESREGVHFLMDWLSQPDAERLDPGSWEQSRSRWIPHAGTLEAGR